MASNPRYTVTINPKRGGVPQGGTTGQVLTKVSNYDWDSVWSAPTGGGASDFSQLTGTLNLNQTSINTNKLLGRGTASVGEFEEITLGTNLSLTGTTLNAASGGASVANPGAQLLGLTAINGSAVTSMRSDGAPALDQSISPTWTGTHTHTLTDANAGLTNLLIIDHESTGAPAVAFGSALLARAETDTTAGRTIGQLSWQWTDVADATRTSRCNITTEQNGALHNSLIIHGSGGISVDSSVDPGAGICNANAGFRVANVAASRKMLVGNGTNFVASTENWAVPGTSGNVLTSDGTNWLSSVPTGGGNVSNTGTPTANQIGQWTSATVIQGITPTSPIVAGAGTLSLNVNVDHAFTAGQSVTINDAETGGATTPELIIGHNTTGTPGNNLGPNLQFNAETSTTPDTRIGNITSQLSTVTHASRASYFDFQLSTGGAAPASKARLHGSGGFSVNSTTDPGAGIINANSGYRVANAAASRKILVGNGTNLVASTETWAVPGTSGNVLTSDGTNWLSSTPSALTVPVSKTAFVDTSGNDGTAAKGDLKKPYLTIADAAAACSSGDKVQVGPGTYAFGSSAVQLPAGVHFQGAGIGVTIITGSTGVTHAVLAPGNGSIISDVTVDATTGSNATPSAPMGVCSADTAVASAIIQRCKLIANSDGFYYQKASTSVTHYDCIVSTTWDTIYQDAACNGVFEYYNCVLLSDGSVIGAGNNASNNIQGGTCRIFGGKTTITSQPSPRGVRAGTAGATAEVTNHRIDVSGSGSPLDLAQSSTAVINIENCWRPDAAALATSGTIGDLKRNNPRETTIASSGTPAPSSDVTDIFTITALAANATFSAPTGTPAQGQPLIIRILDNGTPRTLAWNSIYRAMGASLPTTTVSSTTLYVAFKYNFTDTKWDCMSATADVAVINAITGFTVNGAAASRKILVGDGTNFIPSTETYAVPGTSGNVLTSDGTNWLSSAPAGGGGGTVTHTAGALSADSIVIGNAGGDVKTINGIAAPAAGKIILGTAGVTVGELSFKNATSGAIALSAVTGALGAVTLSLPAATDTLVGKATTDILTNKSIDAAQLTGTIATARLPAFGSGDVSFAASGGAGTIANDSVTYAKIQNVSATSRFLGRITGGAGDTEELTAANAKTILALTATDVGLGNVTNNAQTQSAIVPNTAPSAGQILVGNAGGTAYAPVTMGTDATLASTGALTIAAASVTLAKMANMATSSLIYRKTAASGVPEVNTLATLKTDLLLTGTNSGDQTITLTGDVTGTGTGSFAATIANDAVTYAKIQNVTTARLLGRATAGSGDTEEITLGTNLSFTGTTLNASGGGTFNPAADNLFTAAQSLTLNDAGTNNQAILLTLEHDSTGTPANGLGCAIAFKSETSTTTSVAQGTILTSWTDVTHATRTSRLDLQAVVNGTTGTALSAFAAGISGGCINVGSTTNPGADGVIAAKTGYRVNNAAASGTVLKGDGTNFVPSTETYPAPGAAGNTMVSDGTNWTSVAPGQVMLTVKNVTNLTAGAPADIATIAVPSWVTRWRVIASAAGNSQNVIITETQTGTPAAGTVEMRTAAAGAGTQMLAATAPNNGANTANGWPGATTVMQSSISTIYIRQTANSANSATLSFYVFLTYYP